MLSEELESVRFFEALMIVNSSDFALRATTGQEGLVDFAMLFTL